MDFLQPCAQQMLSIESGETVSESKKTQTEVKSGFSILKKSPKSSFQSSSWCCSELCKDLELGMGLAGHRLWPEKLLSGAGAGPQ